MGNEGSKLKGLVIEANAVEANDFWALYNAVATTTSNEEGKQYLSVFQGEPVVTGQLWVAQGPMERAIKVRCGFTHLLENSCFLIFITESNDISPSIYTEVCLYMGTRWAETSGYRTCASLKPAIETAIRHTNMFGSADNTMQFNISS